MISLNALAGVLEDVYGTCTLKIEIRPNEVDAIVHTHEGAVCGGTGSKPTKALEEVAKRLQCVIAEREHKLREKRKLADDEFCARLRVMNDDLDALQDLKIQTEEMLQGASE